MFCVQSASTVQQRVLLLSCFVIFLAGVRYFPLGPASGVVSHPNQAADTSDAAGALTAVVVSSLAPVTPGAVLQIWPPQVQGLHSGHGKDGC